MLNHPIGGGKAGAQGCAVKRIFMPEMRSRIIIIISISITAIHHDYHHHHRVSNQNNHALDAKTWDGVGCVRFGEGGVVPEPGPGSWYVSTYIG